MTDAERHEALQFIEDVSRKAGDVVLSYYQGEYAIDRKNVEDSKIDIVTDADRASEDLILSAIRERYPDHEIVSEEAPPDTTRSRWKWFVDPIDGTVNFTHGYPAFCISIAVAEDDRLVAGAVFDPLRKETFSSTRGGGARLNGKPIRVSRAERLDRSIVATGFPYDRGYSPNNNLKEFCRVMPHIQGIRRAGSAALDLAYVAAGRLDAFWELKLKPWDMAAGMLLVEEAGGRISDRFGAETSVYTDSVAATNNRIHDALIRLLNEDR